MNSLLSKDNLLFLSKNIVILAAVFATLFYVAEITIYESIILGIIITISLVIIENIFYMNYQATDPLNCEQCKVTNPEMLSQNYIKSNLVPNPMAENTVPEYKATEPFVSNLSNLFDSLKKQFVGDTEKEPEKKQKQKQKQEQKPSIEKSDNLKIKQNIVDHLKDDIQLKCIPMSDKNDDLDSLNKDQLKQLLKIKMQEKKDELPSNEKSIISSKLQEQQNQIKILKDQIDKNTKSSGSSIGNTEQDDPYNNGTDSNTDSLIEGFESIFSDPSDDTEEDGIDSEVSEDLNQVENNTETELASLEQYIDKQNNKNKKLMNKVYKAAKSKKSSNELPNDVQQKIKNVKNKLKKSKTSKISIKPETPEINTESQFVNPQDPGVETSDITYDVNSVEYQQDGLQTEANKISEKNNLFKMAVGNQKVVRPYIKDGEKYYDTIFSVSTDAPTQIEAQNNELKYGYYNYIGPLNKGMINKDYTFIEPTNWYPIPPHPPVCVTNKKCTTCPIQITDGRDYMHFSNLDQFNEARRFTGNMNINTEYVKNVLNKSEAD